MNNLNYINIKNNEEIEKMRAAGRLAANTLIELDKIVYNGITGKEIEDFVKKYTNDNGATCAPYLYTSNGTNVPFPGFCCISPSPPGIACHGIPNNKKLTNCIFNVDVTPILNGYHGDTSVTFVVGEVSDEYKKLISSAYKGMMAGIKEIKAGARLGDIGNAISSSVTADNFFVLKDFYGHSTGRVFHEYPSIPSFGERGKGLRLHAGQTITIEPIVSSIESDFEILSDGWTVKMKESAAVAQFECTVLVLENGFEILTDYRNKIKNSIDII